MLKVSGEFALERVTDETIPLQNGNSFRKVALIGHAPTGWTGQNMPTSVTVAVELSKKALESLGDLNLLPPGSQIIVEEGYIKAGRSKKDPLKVFPTVVATKIHCSAARVATGDHAVAHPGTLPVVPLEEPVANPVTPLGGTLDEIPFAPEVGY